MAVYHPNHIWSELIRTGYIDDIRDRLSLATPPVLPGGFYSELKERSCKPGADNRLKEAVACVDKQIHRIIQWYINKAPAFTTQELTRVDTSIWLYLDRISMDDWTPISTYFTSLELDLFDEQAERWHPFLIRAASIKIAKKQFAKDDPDLGYDTTAITKAFINAAILFTQKQISKHLFENYRDTLWKNNWYVEPLLTKARKYAMATIHEIDKKEDLVVTIGDGEKPPIFIDTYTPQTTHAVCLHYLTNGPKEAFIISSDIELCFPTKINPSLDCTDEGYFLLFITKENKCVITGIFPTRDLARGYELYEMYNNREKYLRSAIFKHTLRESGLFDYRDLCVVGGGPITNEDIPKMTFTLTTLGLSSHIRKTHDV